MPTVVGIFTYMNRINFVLIRVVHEKCFIASGPASDVQSSLVQNPNDLRFTLGYQGFESERVGL